MLLLNLVTAIKRLLPHRAISAIKGTRAYRIYLRELYKRTNGAGSSSNASAHNAGHLRREVKLHARNLWAGYSAQACEQLEIIRAQKFAPSQPIGQACLALSRYYATKGEFHRALDPLIQRQSIMPEWNTTEHLVLHHHCLTQLRRLSEAHDLYAKHPNDPNIQLMEANTYAPNPTSPEAPLSSIYDYRLHLIDSVLTRIGAHSLTDSLSEPSAPLRFSDLAKTIQPTSIDGPPVSVLLPAYNAEETLEVSLSSLLNQTWENLEIIVIDDASTDGTILIAEEFQGRDPRVKVHRHNMNRGAYAARNTGLLAATGNWVTVQDADDWSHPQRIEFQVSALNNNPSAAASFSRLARINHNFEFQIRPFRPMLYPIHWSFTSILADRNVFLSFGGWDAVRAHADWDFIDRLRGYYGRDAMHEVAGEAPLSFFLATGRNLTERAGTTLRSVDFGSRKEYAEQSKYWRARTFHDGRVPSYQENPRLNQRRPFYCPFPLMDSKSTSRRYYDILLGSDLGLLGGTRRCNLAYLHAAQSLGMRVGIFNIPRYRGRNAGVVAGDYRELLQCTNVDLLTPEDIGACHILIIHHPPILQYRFELTPSVDVSEAFLLVNQLPYDLRDQTSKRYESATVAKHFKDIFGVKPTWIPISPVTRIGLLQDGVEPLYNTDWTPILPWQPLQTPRSAPRDPSHPVVGRHSRDDWTKWPGSAAKIRSAYFANRSHTEVKILGGAQVPIDILGQEPYNWEIFPFDSWSIDEFLASIDIFVHYHHELYVEEYGRNIAEAMSLGVPCVLPPHFRGTFGDAALYAEVEEVGTAVDELISNQALYARTSQAGLEYSWTFCSPTVGRERLAIMANES